MLVPNGSEGGASGRGTSRGRPAAWVARWMIRIGWPSFSGTVNSAPRRSCEAVGEADPALGHEAGEHLPAEHLAHRADPHDRVAVRLLRAAVGDLAEARDRGLAVAHGGEHQPRRLGAEKGERPREAHGMVEELVLREGRTDQGRVRHGRVRRPGRRPRASTPSEPWQSSSKAAIGPRRRCRWTGSLAGPAE